MNRNLISTIVPLVIWGIPGAAAVYAGLTQDGNGGYAILGAIILWVTWRAASFEWKLGKEHKEPKQEGKKQ